MKLRDARTVWMVGYAEPPPFSIVGRGRATTWTGWIALLDATTGSFILAMTCGGVNK